MDKIRSSSKTLYDYVLWLKCNTLENFHEPLPVFLTFLAHCHAVCFKPGTCVNSPCNSTDLLCVSCICMRRPIQRILIATATKSRFKNVCTITADTSIYLPTLACEMIQIIPYSCIFHPTYNVEQILKLLVTFFFFLSSSPLPVGRIVIIRYYLK